MSLSKSIRDRVFRATVKLPGKGGRGVLVPGGYILTAAHCVTWDGEGAMALGDWFIETVEGRKGERLLCSVCAADPVADIAALQAPDGQELYEENEAYTDFVEATEPVLLRTKRLPRLRHSSRPSRDFPTIPVWILNKQEEWLSGTATQYDCSSPCPSRVSIRTETKIESGDSGSPVVDEEGRLIGVISWSSEKPYKNGHDKDGWDGVIPVASAALPVWVSKEIRRASVAA